MLKKLQGHCRIAFLAAFFTQASRFASHCCYADVLQDGDTNTQVRFGALCCLSGEFSEGEKWFNAAADKACPEAQLLLGELYLLGQGVSADQARAAGWVRKSAQKGLPDAEAVLGLMYADGKGVPTNQFEAIKWLKAAAHDGSSIGEYWLGGAYFAGEGVAKDL
ncbi:MAG: tetratricopeptide repeat protein, partial [Limisphaerales bacterium]